MNSPYYARDIFFISNKQLKLEANKNKFTTTNKAHQIIDKAAQGFSRQKAKLNNLNNEI